MVRGQRLLAPPARPGRGQTAMGTERARPSRVTEPVRPGAPAEPAPPWAQRPVARVPQLPAGAREPAPASVRAEPARGVEAQARVARAPGNPRSPAHEPPGLRAERVPVSEATRRTAALRGARPSGSSREDRARGRAPPPARGPESTAWSR